MKKAPKKQQPQKKKTAAKGKGKSSGMGRLFKYVALIAILAAAFFLGPDAIRHAYAASTDKADIDNVTLNYWSLTSSEAPEPVQQDEIDRRRKAIADWLYMRRVALKDPVKHMKPDTYAQRLAQQYDTSFGSWCEILGYWFSASEKKDIGYLSANPFAF